MFKGLKKNAHSEVAASYFQEGMDEKRHWLDAAKPYLEASLCKSFTLERKAQSGLVILEWSSCDNQPTHAGRGQTQEVATRNWRGVSGKQLHSQTSHRQAGSPHQNRKAGSATPNTERAIARLNALVKTYLSH